MSAGAGGGPQQRSGRAVYAPTPDYCQLGLTTGLSFVCGSVIVGAVALSTGRKALYDSLFRARMVAVATTMGYYAAASGWLPPPRLLTDIVGREPRGEVPTVRPQQHRPPPS